MVQWTSASHTVDIAAGKSDSELPDILSIASEPILKAFLDSLTDGIIILDRHGRVAHLNPQGAAILGITRAGAVGKHVSELVDFRPVILEVLESGQGYLEKEFFIQSPGRGKLHFLKSAIVLRDKKGRTVGVIDTFRLLDSTSKAGSRVVGLPSAAKFSFDDIIGEEPIFLEALNIAKIAAQSNANVLIEGGSGTGKEMFAQAIHQASSRSSGPLVIVNCSSLPPSLIESELFGYESGSFTGARKEGFPGKFEQADGGTIFLDEIGEMPLDMQSKLLRVLQDHTFTRIGGIKNITVDVRVIAATNKKLLTEIRGGNFREDLYYRLNVLSVHIPSLGERLDDIPLLVSRFVRETALLYGKPVPVIDKEVLRIFREYAWPGNVRELENVIERAIVISQSPHITVRQLPDYIVNSLQGSCDGAGADENGNAGEGGDRENPGSHNLEKLEKNQIRLAFRESGGNVSRCAKMLGISRNTLYRKLKYYSLA